MCVLSPAFCSVLHTILNHFANFSNLVHSLTYASKSASEPSQANFLAIFPQKTKGIIWNYRLKQIAHCRIDKIIVTWYFYSLYHFLVVYLSKKPWYDENTSQIVWVFVICDVYLAKTMIWWCCNRDCLRFLHFPSFACLLPGAELLCWLRVDCETSLVASDTTTRFLFRLGRFAR